MTRATKTITLALISSSLILAGCKKELPPDEEDHETSGSYSSSHGVHHTTHGYHGPLIIPMPMGGGFTTVNRGAAPSGGASSHSTTSSTSRGGFGSTGAAATHGSTGT